MAKKKSVGLGDTLEKVTKKTGIKKVVEKVFKDCGCNDRQEWLNKQFPYYNKVKNCMTEEQYEAYKEYKERNPKALHEEDQNLILGMYNSIFAVEMKPCKDCGAETWKAYLTRLDNVYKTYDGAHTS